ncbi:MAG: hypothetical protein AB9835_10375 [Eubacteriales bacterium]
MKISIAKALVDDDTVKPAYCMQDIVERFHFSKRDIRYQIDIFFFQNDEQYELRPDINAYLKKVIQAHKCVLPKLEEAESFYLKRFGQFSNNWRTNHTFDSSSLRQVYKEIEVVIPILHCGRLPIYNKYLMINSRLIPEKELTEFYRNYDMLYAMLKDINGEGECMELNGDQTLDKEMTFSVYTRRWGHQDIYRICRTVDGWEVKHLAIDGACEKDGTGALLQNLQHDCVFYPEDGVKYALSKLWEQADDGDLNFEQLQQKLQQIADWISVVEQAVGKGQPDWVGYY